MLHHVYRLIWLLLLFLTGCYELLRFLILGLRAKYLKSYDQITTAGEMGYKRDVAFLERCKSELHKIPTHFNVIIGPNETFGAEQLSRIAFYALNMGIDYVSFYDTRSIIAAEEEHSGTRRCGITLKDLRPPKFFSSTKVQQNRVRWSLACSDALENGSSRPQSNGSLSNGINGGTKLSREPSIEVVMLTPKHGRPLIAEVCRDLFRQRRTQEIQNLLQDRTSLMERIDMELSGKLNKLPDPELGVIFHRDTCTFGLLPWQTRFTEFYTIETGRYFNVETFAKVLYKYSRCEQRWGK